jgi:hypothetical protein
LRGINAFGGGDRFMSPLQGTLRTSALVMAVAFPHHAVQEKTAPEAWAKSRKRAVFRSKNGERRGGE